MTEKKKSRNYTTGPNKNIFKRWEKKKEKQKLPKRGSKRTMFAKWGVKLQLNLLRGVTQSLPSGGNGLWRQLWIGSHGERILTFRTKSSNLAGNGRVPCRAQSCYTTTPLTKQRVVTNMKIIDCTQKTIIFITATRRFLMTQTFCMAMWIAFTKVSNDIKKDNWKLNVK